MREKAELLREFHTEVMKYDHCRGIGLNEPHLQEIENFDLK